MWLPSGKHVAREFTWILGVVFHCDRGGQCCVRCCTMNPVRKISRHVELALNAPLYTILFEIVLSYGNTIAITSQREDSINKQHFTYVWHIPAIVLGITIHHNSDGWWWGWYCILFYTFCIMHMKLIEIFKTGRETDNDCKIIVQ